MEFVRSGMEVSMSKKKKFLILLLVIAAAAGMGTLLLGRDNAEYVDAMDRGEVVFIPAFWQGEEGA